MFKCLFGHSWQTINSYHDLGSFYHVDDDNKPVWDTARKTLLVFQKCSCCNKERFYATDGNDTLNVESEFAKHLIRKHFPNERI